VKFPGGGTCHDIGLENWEKRDGEETEAWAFLGRHHLLINVSYIQYPVGNLMLGSVLRLSVDPSGKIRCFQRMLSAPQRDRRVVITLFLFSVDRISSKYEAMIRHVFLQGGPSKFHNPLFVSNRFLPLIRVRYI
jgi:hypothetical protein